MSVRQEKQHKATRPIVLSISLFLPEEGNRMRKIPGSSIGREYNPMNIITSHV
jgi:hypothetical protein